MNGSPEYGAAMKPSGWLYLATGCLAVLGLVVWWPFMIVAVFVSLGAWKQRQVEKKAHRELVARMRATGRN